MWRQGGRKRECDQVAVRGDRSFGSWIRRDVTLTGKADAPPPPEAGAWTRSRGRTSGMTSPLASPMSADASMSAGSNQPPSETPNIFRRWRLRRTTCRPLRRAAMASPVNHWRNDPAEPIRSPRHHLRRRRLVPPPSHIWAEASTQARSAPADAHDEFSVAWGEAQNLCDQGRLGDALLMLSEWTTNTRLSPADRDRLMDRLDQLAGTVVYSRQHMLEQPYTVQPGDTLEKVAGRLPGAMATTREDQRHRRRTIDSSR